MKNSLLTLTRTALLSIICIVSMLKTHAMDEKEPESLTVGYISIAGIDRQELIKALYEHAMDHDHAQIARTPSTALPTS